MPTLKGVLREQTDLDAADVEVAASTLRRLVAALRPVFRRPGPLGSGHCGGWYAAAHIRPTTGPMVFFDDIVGRRLDRGRRPLLDQAFTGLRIVRGGDPERRDDMPIRE